jgi:hypothetical protein
MSSFSMLVAALATCRSYRYHYRMMHSNRDLQAEGGEIRAASAEVDG